MKRKERNWTRSGKTKWRCVEVRPREEEEEGAEVRWKP